MTGTGSREEILRRIRSALRDVPHETPEQDAPVARDYLEVHAQRSPEETADLLADHLADYRAHVHRTDGAGLAGTLARLLTAHGSHSAVIPPGLPYAWLAEVEGVELLRGAAEMTARQLDAVDSVVTGCALAVAETGTIVLDGGDGQGERRLTLVPDHHVCVVFAPEQVVGSVPQAMPRLDPARPLTWISGPSATSDIELDRVEGVHGPRTLDVVIVGER